MKILYVDCPSDSPADDNSLSDTPSILNQSFDSPSPWTTKTARESALENFTESSDLSHLINYLKDDPEKKEALDAVDALGALKSRLDEALRVREIHKARVEELKASVNSYEQALRADTRVVSMLQTVLGDHIDKIIKML